MLSQMMRIRDPVSDTRMVKAMAKHVEQYVELRRE
jgi:hypothetical protein